ncbi:MFS transporter, OCT family, solute carrier family 22 (organic cation transporter), member 4/5 [Mytilus galloprovincialis]|uniref:MFS transporter, OCT family, solute carrier family 22 (Organic cation transporter), member 4/5 n=1 Tax=Mytilus galloprovincialis TaxID=29158 RepID=A0A8B6HNI5_MYTGA|nr:MFS transporter, OCT family, solute carrier family 22 (organic cation transporter), member 4/5 [Mytilus galloprovincialis]
MTSDVNEYLENILDDVGGLGLFQWILITIVLGSKISVSWSTLMMTFGGAVPDWHCFWTTVNGTEYYTNQTFMKTCELYNTSEPVMCQSQIYDPDMATVVSEWDLVCEKDWIASTITTIQMGGLLFGGFVSGQLADVLGRKFTYFAALFILLVFNGAAAFSTSWEMFAVFRFFIGIGCGFYLTVYFTFLIEFTPRTYRSMLVALPFWPIFCIIYACMCWWLHEWKYIQLAIAATNIPFILAIFFVPESYRWLVSNGKIAKAHNVISKIAKINGKPPPDFKTFYEMASQATKQKSTEKRYTILDVIKNRRLLRYNVLLSVGWLSCGYGYYAISFGVQQLSGNLYVNLILINAMDIIGIVVWYLANCLGRKWTTFMLFLIGGSMGIVVGIIQFIDLSDKDELVNGFALASKLCVSSGWSALMILTSELYPTVVRNIGYGINNAVARLGAMVAPQLVFASEKIDGLSYLSFAGMMFLSAILVVTLPETNKTALQDTMDITISQKKSDKQSIMNPGYEKENYGTID